MTSLIVYVKHYLTPEGIAYFEKEWFPEVLDFMSQQQGYLSCIYQIVGDCIDITIKFKDETTFDAYADVPEHNQLAKMLDDYRSRNYWEAVRTTDPEAALTSLEWDVIDPICY